MNIVVERSSDDDYSSLSSCSSLGENLDNIFEHNLQAEEAQGYRFQPIQDSYNSKSREAQISQMEEEDEYCM